MKPPRPPKFVTLAIMTTITIVFWVFFSVYKILTTQTAPSVSEEILAPVSPSLDSESLTEIGNSVYFEDDQITSLSTNQSEETEEELVVDTEEPADENNDLEITPTPIVEESNQLNDETQDIDTTDGAATAG